MAAPGGIRKPEPAFAGETATKSQGFWHRVGHQIVQFLGKVWQAITGLFGRLSGKSREAASALMPKRPGSPLHENWPVGPLNTQQVFGENPSHITFRQNGGNTCYLLAALDGILHHPQSRDILATIGFEKTKDDYIVTFPGQREPVHVSPQDLRSDGVQSDNPGIRLLEAAYFKIPENQGRWGEFDTSNFALRRMFGDDILVSAGEASLDPVPVQDAMQLATVLDTEADIWTATRRHTDQDGNAKSTGIHYFTLRFPPDVPDFVQLIDPFDTSRVVETLTFPQLNERYHVEMSRLRIPQD